MKKLFNFFKNNFLLIYLLLNMLILFGCSFVTTYIFYFGDLDKYVMIVLSILNIFISFGLIFKHRKKLSVIDLLLLLLINCFLISTIYAINHEVAIFGFNGRYEGLFAFVYYLTLFYIATYLKQNQKKAIIITLIIFGLVEALYGYFQLLGLYRIVVMPFKTSFKITGTIGNPNFYASFILLSLTSTIGLFVDEKDKYKSVLLFIIMIILLSVLLFSNTNSCLVGLIVTLLFLFIYCIKKKKIFKFILIVLTFVSLLFIYASFNKTKLVKEIIKTSNEIQEIQKGNYDESYGTYRLEVWKKTIEKAPDYWAHGAGLDNYYYAFGKYPLKVGKYVFDKAHNEYLQILITQGVFSLICFILIYLIMTIKGLKESFNNSGLYCFLPVVGYLVQAFFNISVVMVAPYFFIILGMNNNR